jgi:hypothetical protein
MVDQGLYMDMTSIEIFGVVLKPLAFHLAACAAK